MTVVTKEEAAELDAMLENAAYAANLSAIAAKTALSYPNYNMNAGRAAQAARAWINAYETKLQIIQAREGRA